jgi:hypothetical protein
MNVPGLCNDIEDPAGDVCHSKRMLKSGVSGARIDMGSQRKLLNVAKALQGSGIDEPSLIVIELDKPVDGITELVHHPKSCFKLYVRIICSIS